MEMDRKKDHMFRTHVLKLGSCGFPQNHVPDLNLWNDSLDPETNWWVGKSSCNTRYFPD